LLLNFPRVLSRHSPRLSPAGGASNIERATIGLFPGTNDAERNSNMNKFALGVLLSLALSAQGFAIIRSPYPTKTQPPSHGRFIVVGDDAKSQIALKPPK
jgi:hypothetical protein